MATASTLSELLTPEQTADYLGLCVQTLSVWRSAGRHGLPFVKIGSRVRYRAADVEKFLADHTAMSTSGQSNSHPK